MIDSGWKLKNAEAPSSLRYFHAMLSTEHLVTMQKAGALMAFCTFFIGESMEDVGRFYARSPWSLPEDHLGGSLLYLDLLCATHWNRELRTDFESAMVWKFPRLTHALWHRAKPHRPDWLCGCVLNRSQEVLDGISI